MCAEMLALSAKNIKTKKHVKDSMNYSVEELIDGAYTRHFQAHIMWHFFLVPSTIFYSTTLSNYTRKFPITLYIFNFSGRILQNGNNFGNVVFTIARVSQHH